MANVPSIDELEARIRNLNDTFIFTRHRQPESRLLCLPAELRLKILRYLHRHDGPIKSLREWKHFLTPNTNEVPDRGYARKSLREWKHFLSTKEAIVRSYARGVSLSSHLLRCCQQLHDEAIGVLYGENVLSIYCCNELKTMEHGCRDTIVGVLDTDLLIDRGWLNVWNTISSPAKYFCQHEPCGIFRWGHYPALWPSWRCLLARQAWRYRQNLPAIARFSQLHVYFDTNHEFRDSRMMRVETSLLCRNLRPFVANKDVTLTMGETMQTDMRLSTLGFARVLRCRSIQSPAYPGGFPPALSQVILSSMPVRDLCTETSTIVDLVSALRDSARATLKHRYPQGTSAELEELAWSYDVEAFQRKKLSMLGEIRELHKAQRREDEQRFPELPRLFEHPRPPPHEERDTLSRIYQLMSGYLDVASQRELYLE